MHKKGLCFKCVEKWGKEHVCKFNHMKLMLCEVEESSEEEDTREEEEKDDTGELKILQLSLHGMEELTSNKFFKVHEEIDDRKVLALIDSGDTTNFILPKLIEELNIKVTETSVYIVKVGTGELVWIKVVCKYMRFNVQGGYLSNISL